MITTKASKLKEKPRGYLPRPCYQDGTSGEVKDAAIWLQLTEADTDSVAPCLLISDPKGKEEVPVFTTLRLKMSRMVFIGYPIKVEFKYHP